MDPLSALSVAAAVVQFVDFASKLISTASRIQNSLDGYDDSISDIRAVSERLLVLNENVKKGCDLQPINSTNIAIKKLCSDCNDVGDQILKRSQDLGAGPNAGKRAAIVAALRTAWSQKELSGLQKRLDSYRRQISEHIITAILAQAIELQNDHRRYGDASAASHKETQDMIKQLQTGLKKRDLEPRDVMKAINIKHSLLSELTIGDPCASPLGQGALDSFRLQMWHALRYESVDTRGESIDDAHSATFDWIFRKEPVDHPRHCSFASWLESSDALYWITGKPGAGKSTLMKFIAEDPRLLKSLKVWTGDNNLSVLHFYSWNAGTTHQASFEGLLRTFLYQLTYGNPDLLPKIFPIQFEALLLLGESQSSVAKLSIDDLQDAFKRYIQHLGSDANLFVLIDGLDEFKEDHIQLVRFIRTLAVPRIKACVSSRPWPVFQDAYQTVPNLTMQDLTRPDIRAYVEAEFAASPGYIPRSIASPDATNLLVTTVIDKADGVFLWVHCVVSTLLEGFSEGSTISDLQKRLDAIPPKVEDLFQSIFDSLDLQSQARFAEYFHKLLLLKQLEFDHDQRSIEALTFAFADESIDDILHAVYGFLDAEILVAKIELCQRRVNESCKGLIEIRSAPLKLRHVAHQSDPLQHYPYQRKLCSTVEYAHRTVKEHWEKQENRARLLAACGTEFHPHNQLLGAIHARLKFVENSQTSRMILGHFFEASRMIRATDYARTVSSIACQIRLLDDFSAITNVRKELNEPTPSDTWSDKYIPEGSFLDIACVAGLTDYVNAQIEATEGCERTDLLESLLELIMFSGALHGPRSDMIDLLLSHGVNLKALAKGNYIPIDQSEYMTVSEREEYMTVSERELQAAVRKLDLTECFRYTLECRMYHSYSDDSKEAVLQTMIDDTQAFLKAGADPSSLMSEDPIPDAVLPEWRLYLRELLVSIPQLAEAQRRRDRKESFKKYLPWVRKS